MMKNIIYIHGANSTNRSWSYIQPSLPEHEAHMIEYDTHKGVDTAVNDIVSIFKDKAERYDIVSHSLGGVIALTVASKLSNIDRIVTISSPFGGSSVAGMVNMVKPSQILYDISPYGKFALKFVSRNYKFPVPTKSIVTHCDGISFLSEQNDGVLTLNSQKAIQTGDYVDFNCNHFEILMDRNVVDIIKNHLWVE